VHGSHDARLENRPAAHVTQNEPPLAGTPPDGQGSHRAAPNCVEKRPGGQAEHALCADSLLKSPGTQSLHAHHKRNEPPMRPRACAAPSHACGEAGRRKRSDGARGTDNVSARVTRRTALVLHRYVGLHDRDRAALLHAHGLHTNAAGEDAFNGGAAELVIRDQESLSLAQLAADINQRSIARSASSKRGATERCRLRTIQAMASQF
jgi:hypothetical protein